MYNGVGILTPRGTGTSGHVQTNKFNLRRAPVPKFGSEAGAQQHADRKPNKDILEHNRRRQLEIKLLELREQLEEAGCAQHAADGAPAGGGMQAAARAHLHPNACAPPTHPPSPPPLLAGTPRPR